MRKLTALFATLVLCALQLMAQQPTVTTLPVQDIGHYAVDAYGEVNAGGSPISIRGFLWSSTDMDPDQFSNDGMTSENPPYSTDTYTLIADQLQELTTYYLRAFAEDDNGAFVLGNVVSFTTLAGQQPNDACQLGRPITSFGMNGKSELTEASNYNGTDVAIDTEDNAYIVGGYTDNNTILDGFKITAIDADGQLRANWNNNGTFTFPTTFVDTFYTTPKATTDMMDHLFVAAGYYTVNNEYGVVFAKMMKDGQLDPNFGVQGLSFINFNHDVVITDIQEFNGDLFFTAKGDDAGMSVMGKLDSNGSMDMNFGTNGIIVVDNPNDFQEGFLELYIDQSSEIFVLRRETQLDQNNSPVGYMIKLEKYGSVDGSQDFNFGNNGSVMTFGNILDYSNDAELTSDGMHLFVAMPFSNGVIGGGIAAIDMNGNFDMQFGTDGVTTDQYFREGALYGDLVAGQDGYLYLSATQMDQNYNQYNLLQRIDMTGNNDFTFDTLETRNTFNSYGNQSGEMALFSDGSLLITNRYDDGQGSYNNMVDAYRICTDGGKGAGGDEGEGEEELDEIFEIVTNPIGRGNFSSEGNESIEGIMNPRYVTSTRQGMLIIDSEGKLWAVGTSSYGELGYTGTNTEPQLIDNGEWMYVESSYNHTMAIKADGTLWGMGMNTYGQAAYGAGSSISTLTQVMSGTTWESVATGFYHTVAVKSDGTLWAWGYNAYGQLGTGSTGYTATAPAQIGSDTDWDKAYAGYFTSGATKENGEIYTWGYGSIGSLGTGNTSSVYSPTYATELNALNPKDFSLGYYATLAVDENGNLYGFGRQYYGSLGNQTYFSLFEDGVLISSTGDWQQVETAAYHSIIMKEDGSIYQLGSTQYNGTSGPIELQSDKWTGELSASYYSTSTTNYAGTVESVIYIRNPDKLEQASYIGVASKDFYEFSFIWANGNGDGRFVVITEDGYTPYVPTSDDLETIELESEPMYMEGNIVFRTAGNSMSIDGLYDGTEYHVKVYEYFPLGNVLTDDAPGNPRTITTIDQLDITINMDDVKVTGKDIWFDWSTSDGMSEMYTYYVGISTSENDLVPPSGYPDFVDVGNMSEFKFGDLPADMYYIFIDAVSPEGQTGAFVFGPYELLNPEPGYIMAINFEERNENSMDISWMSQSAENYLVFAYEDMPGNERYLEDGMELGLQANSDYSMATSAFAGIDGRLVYDGDMTSTTITGLPSDTPMYYVVVPYNGSGDLINYGSPRVATHTTLATQPMDVTNVLATQNGKSYMVSFDYSGESAMVLINVEGRTDMPEDGMGYELYDDIGGERVYYMTDQMTDGGSAEIEITDFTPGNSLDFTIYTYNGDVYSMATGNTGMEGSQRYSYGVEFMFTPVGEEPSPVTAEVVSRNVNSIELDWSMDAMNAVVGADNYLVLAMEVGEQSTPMLMDSPEDGMAYLNGAPLGTSFDFGTYAEMMTLGAYVLYNGSSTSTTVEGLDAETEYAFFVFPYTGGEIDGDQNYASTAQSVQAVTYAAIPPSISGLEVTAKSQTTIDLGWSNPNGETVVILRSDMDFDCELMMGSDSGQGVEMASCNAEVLYVGTGESFQDTELTAGTEYFYDVYTRDGANYGDFNTYNYSEVQELVDTTNALPTPSVLAITTSPSQVTSGEDFTVTVTLYDQYETVINATQATTVNLEFNGSTIGTGTMASGSSTVEITGNLTASAQEDAEINATATGLSAGTATVDILAGEPGVITNIGISVYNKYNIELTYDIPSEADGVLIYARKNNSIPADTYDPTDGQTYTASAFDNTSDDTQLVYSGSAESFNLTNLSRSKRYYFAIYTYAGSGAGINYNPTEQIINDRTKFKEGSTAEQEALIAENGFLISGVFPNPASSEFQFLLDNALENNVFEMWLSDQTGRKVASLMSGASYSVASHGVSIDIPAGLASGQYFLIVDNGMNTQSLPVIIQR